MNVYLRWFIIIMVTWLTVFSSMLLPVSHKLLHKYGILNQVEVHDCLELYEFRDEHSREGEDDAQID